MTLPTHVRATDAQGLFYRWPPLRTTVGTLQVQYHPTMGYLICGANCQALFVEYRRACLSVGAWLGGMRL